MMVEYTGAKYAIATVNGTAALHMSLILADVQRDDLVITQPVSFVATCNSISYIGASPLFVDIDLDTLGMSPTKLEHFLCEKTIVKNGRCYHKETGRKISACVPMHTFGHPVNIDKIADLCQEYHIALVEDAAESIGSKYKDKHTGTFGLVGAFSFNGNKTITCGGGGCIITNDQNLAKFAKHLTTQAKVPHKWDFVHDHIGYNYRMPNINAALACAQMEKLDEFIIAKRKLAAKYHSFFSGMGIKFVIEPDGSYSNYWLNAVILDSKEQRDTFLTESNNSNIMTRPLWRLTNKLEMFKDCICENLDNSEYIESRLVNLPSSVIL
jgi:aminotransferase in exopolysaccharide biosynthesis